MLNLARAPHRLVRRLAVTLAVDLAALLFTCGCGGASPPAGAPASMAPGAMAEAAPMPPPPPAQPAGPAAAGYAPPPAPGDAIDRPASYAPEPSAPPPAAAPGPAVRAPSAAPKAPSAADRAPAPVAKAPPPPPPGKAAPPTAAKTVEPGPAKTAAQAPSVQAAPLLIYVGDIQMMVPEAEGIPASIDKVIDLAESLGGYLAGRKDTSVQVRIPSMRFREGFTMIEKLGDVTHRSVTADDVSEQYSNLEVRLQNLRATQKRLQEFLAKANNVQEMLNVGRELERVAGEMEAIEGKMRFLRSRAAFSLVTVGFQVKPKNAIVIAKNETPPPRQISLPINWLPRVGLDTLLNLQ